MGQIIDYRTPASIVTPARSPWWWLLLGPMLGGAFGFGQGIALGTIATISHRFGTTISGDRFSDALMCGVLAMLIGFPVGITFAMFEYESDRRVRIMRVALEAALCMAVLDGIIGPRTAKYSDNTWPITTAIFAGLGTAAVCIYRALKTARTFKPVARGVGDSRVDNGDH